MPSSKTHKKSILSQSKLELGMKLAGLGFGEIDYFSNTIIFDAVAAEIFGLEPNVPVSRFEVRALFHPDDAAALIQHLDDIINAGKNGIIKLEHRVVRKDNATRWVSAQKQIFFGKDEMGKLVPKTGIVLLRETTADKKSAEHIRVLMLEVNHRSNNLLSVVSAMARQTATMAEPTKFVSHLTDRIAGLAVTQNLLVNSKWGGVDIFELLMAHLSLFGNEFGKRVTLKGPKISVNPAAMQLMGMAVHELSTNAALFGALSNDNGTISVNWEALKKPIAEFQITWRERGGPSVNKSSHKGFGHRVIVEIIEAGVNGKVHLNQLATGLVWQLVAPLAQITETK